MNNSFYKHWQVLFSCYKERINMQLQVAQNRMLSIKQKVRQEKIKADLWWSWSACTQQMVPIVGCETCWTSFFSLTLMHWSITDTNKEKECRFWLTEWFIPHMRTLRRGSLERNSFTFWATKCFFFVFVLLANDETVLPAEAIVCCITINQLSHSDKCFN